MRDISVEPINAEAIIKKKLNDLKYSDIEIKENIIIIKDENGDILSNIEFDFNEFSEEIENITYYEEDYVLFKDSAVFLLRDNFSKIQNGMMLQGSFSGEIKKYCDSKALILLSVNKYSSKYALEGITTFDQFLDEDIVQVEIRNVEISDEDHLLKIVNSIISTLSYQCNIILESMKSLHYEPSEPEEKSVLRTYNPSFIEPILYFNSAEKTDYLHIKYLEYYHVIEYFFLLGRVKEIDKLIKDAIKIQVVQNLYSDNDKYLEIINKINRVYEHKEFDGELNQLKYVMKCFIGINLIESIITEIFKSDISFLKKKIFEIDETAVDISIFKDQRKKKADPIQEEAFLNGLSQRIYRIRNFLVHTKKGEDYTVFTPIPEVLDCLENDIKLMRSIAYSLLGEEFKF